MALRGTNHGYFGNSVPIFSKVPLMECLIVKTFIGRIIKILKDLDLPDIRWQDLRSTYCTLLVKADFSPEAVSKLMGSAKEIITMDVDGDKKNIIMEEIPELLEYMDEVMPEKSDAELQEILDVNIDISKYLCGN